MSTLIRGAKKQRVALVIGSGGIKCAAAIGVWEVLNQENIDIDIVVGCSGGSVFGALIALGADAKQMTKLREDLWTAEITKRINYRNLGKIILPKVFGFDENIGIFDDRVVTRNLERGFGKDTTFADTRIPFFCVTTDIHSGRPVVLSSGPLAKAVRASSGIPVIFEPVEWDGRYLVDGGLSNPLPTDVAVDAGATLIIAVGFNKPLRASVKTAGNFANQMFNIMINQLLSKRFAYDNLAYHGEIILIIPHFDEEIHIDRVEMVPQIIEKGRQQTLMHIQYIKKLIAGEFD
jgi:NTE family protein